MKRFAIIGLGHFGLPVARTLYEEGAEVIAIDLDKEAVQTASEFATQAIIADAIETRTLEAIGIKDVDVAIVSLGKKMDAITLVALHLKELNVPYIAVKALSNDHVKILKALGVHEVVHPEIDTAIRLANRLVRNNVVELLPLTIQGFSVIEMKAPRQFISKTLKELDFRTKLKVQVVAIQSQQHTNRTINLKPCSEDVIQENDLLVLIGENENLDKLSEMVFNDEQ